MNKLLARIRQRKSKSKPTRKYRCVSKKQRMKKLMKAIKGSFGNINVIATRMNRPYSTVYVWIKQGPDYIQEMMREERERLVDIAEQTNVEMMLQRIHFPTAIRASHFVLTRHPQAEQRGYKEKSEVTIQGGKNPIQFQNEHILSIEKLKTIPIDVRKKMLYEIEEKTG